MEGTPVCIKLYYLYKGTTYRSYFTIIKVIYSFLSRF